VYVLAGNAYCPTVRSEIDSCCVNFRAYGSPVLDLHPDDEAAARRGQIRAKISWARLAAVPRASTAFSRRQAMSRRCGSVWLAAES
jgi:hypothetical protein